VTYDHGRQRKTLQQLSQLIAHETDDDKIFQLVAEVQAIMQAEQTEIRKSTEPTTGIASKLAQERVV